MRIRRRVPLLVIHAVEDARKRLDPALQQSFQAAALLDAFDLFGVAGADGRDLVGVGDARLQHVEVTVELRAFRVEVVPGQTRAAVARPFVAALVGEVVDREKSLRRLEPGFAGAPVVDVEGNQPGLPVMRVQHLRPHGHRKVTRQIHRRARQEDEPLRVVRIVADGVVVEFRPAVELGLVDEVDRDALGRGVGLHRAMRHPKPDRQVQPPIHRLKRSPVHLHRSIQRSDHAHGVTGLGEELGQGPDHVGQAAGF